MTSPYLRVLYEQIDARVAALSAEHASALQCKRGCSGCCQDGLTVGPAEAAGIIDAVGDHLRGASPGPEGACAFLGAEGECRIYAARPQVCRTQGLPLRWVEDGVEYRDICNLNAPHVAVDALGPASCWTLGPVEERLTLMALASGERDVTRVPLRELAASLCGKARPQPQETPP